MVFKQTSSPNLEPKEDSKTTVSPSKKGRPSSEQPWGNALRGVTSTSLTGCSRLWSLRLRTSHNRLNAHMFKKMKLAPSPTCNCGLEDQKAERILQRCPLLQTARKACGQRQSSYTPNSTAARRNWRRQPQSSCTLDSQCSGDREEESTKAPVIF